MLLDISSQIVQQFCSLLRQIYNTCITFPLHSQIWWSIKVVHTLCLVEKLHEVKNEPLGKKMKVSLHPLKN